MTIKKTVTISEYIEQYSGDWPPVDAIGFIEWLQRKVDAVPEEIRGTARIDISTKGSDGDDYPYIKISYIRPETDAEAENRESIIESKNERQRQKDLRALAALQEKYGQATFKFVYEHVLKNNRSIVVRCDGKPEYEITVRVIDGDLK